MVRLGYYAKHKVNGALYQFRWILSDDKLEICVIDKHGAVWHEVDPNDYEILEIGFFTADD